MSLKDVGDVSVARGVLSPKEMRQLDKKMDDGIANRGMLTGTSANPPSGSGVVTCATAGDYDVANSTIRSCRAIYWF